ncbi:MAG: RnfABCDGE type electron transport complex subunit D [Elusimicrobiota bacterium]
MNKLTKIKTLKIKPVIMVSLLILAGVGTATYGLQSTGYQLLIAAGVAGFLDFVFILMKKGDLAFPSSGIITGLIIALVLKQGTNPSIVAFASTVAILSKYIIIYNRGHVFNPANFGILISLLAFDITLSWWGGIPTWLVVALGLMIIFKYQRVSLVIIFFITSLIVMSYFTLPRGGILANNLRSFNYFFLFFMVTDPKTSPIKKSGRIFYGIMVAVFSAVFFALDIININYWIAGLAGANLIVPVINWLTVKRSAVNRVEDTKKNRKICAQNCGKCPTFSQIDGEILFCARGTSADKTLEKKGCWCPECDVQKASGCTGTYYCIYGENS